MPEKIFDVIVFADVLEHLKKPEEVLIKMKRFLKDDGFMVISLPNIAQNGPGIDTQLWVQDTID